MRVKRGDNISENTRKADEGFTLVETLITAFVLLFVLMGVTQTYIHSMRLSETARMQSRAISEAQDIIETIREEDFGDIVTTWNINGANAVQLNSVNGNYTVTIWDSPSAFQNSIYTEDYLGIAVTVNWQTDGPTPMSGTQTVYSAIAGD